VGTAKVLVVTRPHNVEVVAYHAWCMGSITLADAPTLLRTGAGRYPQPVALLTRLGVSMHNEVEGLGTGLLQDVIGRNAQLGAEIGCRRLLVHAETAKARNSTSISFPPSTNPPPIPSILSY